VKITVHAEGSQGADVKHKVFWVGAANRADADADEADRTAGNNSHQADRPADEAHHGADQPDYLDQAHDNADHGADPVHYRTGAAEHQRDTGVRHVGAEHIQYADHRCPDRRRRRSGR